MQSPRIALVIDEADGHVRTLLAAFAELDVVAAPIRLADVAFDTASPHGVTIPGFSESLPDAVLIRGFGGGGFEAVTRRLGLLHALRRLGTTVWNDARAIECCVDKSTTSFLLHQAGIATPPTWSVEGLPAAQELAARETQAGARLVCKPLFGAQGAGLLLVAAPQDLPPSNSVGNVYHLQRYVPTGTDSFCDHRLFVVSGKVVGAMTRRAPHWITNVRRGAQPEPLAPSDRMCELAIHAADCVGANYAGIDLLMDETGQLMVLEVNSMPGWKGLQTVVGTSIATRIAHALVAAAR